MESVLGAFAVSSTAEACEGDVGGADGSTVMVRAKPPPRTRETPEWSGVDSNDARNGGKGGKTVEHGAL